MNAKYYGVDVSKDHLDVACEDRVYASGLVFVPKQVG